MLGFEPPWEGGPARTKTCVHRKWEDCEDRTTITIQDPATIRIQVNPAMQKTYGSRGFPLEKTHAANVR